MPEAPETPAPLSCLRGVAELLDISDPINIKSFRANYPYARAFPTLISSKLIALKRAKGYSA